MHLALTLALTGQQGGGAIADSAAITYVRGSPDVLTMRLATATGGNVGDPLSLSTLTLDGGNVSANETMTDVQLAANTAPGAKSGSGLSLSGLNATPTAGRYMLLGYKVTANDGTGSVFPGAGGVFNGVLTGADMPDAVGGPYFIIAPAAAGATVVARTNGNITISELSLQPCEWTYNVPAESADLQIVFAITRGDQAPRGGSVFVPGAGEYYVSPTGSDTTGTGAEGSPYRTKLYAATQAAAAGGGDVILRPGTYPGEQFEDLDGTSETPIRFTTKPGEEQLAIIAGDLDKHVAAGGTGESVPPDFNDNEANRDGMRFARCNHIVVEKLRFRDFWRAGIFITGGTYGDTYTGYRIRDNLIERTGSSNIVVQGKPGATQLAAAETISFLSDIEITGNTCRYANQPNDYFTTSVDDVVVAGSDTEALSVVWGVEDILVDGNIFEDGANYGPDFKVGVRNFTFTNNIVRRMRKYGVYLDTGPRDLVTGRVAGNTISQVQIGICLSREAAAIGSGPGQYADYATAKAALDPGFFIQKFDTIDVFNNTISDTEEAGIRCERHPTKDGPDGEITGVRIRFNDIYNANRSGTAKDLFLSGWSDADFLSASVVTGFDFIGNAIGNDTANIDVTDTFTGQAGFTVRHNFNLADGPGDDPLWTDPANGDFSRQVNSPLVGLVTTAGDADAPFNLDKGGNERLIDAGAGAFTPPVIVTPASIGGTLVEGETITLTPAVFSAGDGTTVNRIETSADGSAPWSDSGATLNWTAVEGLHVRGVSSRTTSGGTVTSTTASQGPIAAATDLTVMDEGDGTLSVTWTGTLDSITITGGGPHDGTYTAYADGEPLAFTRLPGFAGRALDITATTGTNALGETLTAGDILVLYADGQPEPAIAYQWQADGVDISGATSSTYVVQAGDAGADIRPTFVITAASQTTVIEAGSAISIPAGGSGIAADLHVVLAHTGGSTTTQSFTVDFSTFTAGQEVLLVYGISRDTTGLTVNGSNATLVQATGGSAGQRVTAYKYTLQAGDIGSVSVVVTVATADDDGTLAVFDLGTGAIGGSAQGRNGDGGTVINAVTPLSTTNIVLTVALGQEGNFSGTISTPPPTYLLGTEIYNSINLGTGSDVGMSFARITNASTSGVTENITGSGVAGDRFGAITVVVE